MLKLNDDLVGRAGGPPQSTTAMRFVYRIPLIGWGLEGLLADPRPKARLAGLFVLLGAPTVAVLLMGWWGAFLPLATLAVLTFASLVLVSEI